MGNHRHRRDTRPPRTVTLSTIRGHDDGRSNARSVVVHAFPHGHQRALHTRDPGETVAFTVDAVLDDSVGLGRMITLSVTPASVDEDAGATTLTVTATLNRRGSTNDRDRPSTLSVDRGNRDGTATDYTATTANAHHRRERAKRHRDRSRSPLSPTM